MSDQQNLYTLAEASALTGRSIEALRLRVKRSKLEAERGNDGQPRVRLTSTDLEGFDRQLAQQKPTLTRQDADKANAIRVLESAVGALREQAERAEAAREAAQAALAEARERVGRAEAEAAAQRDSVAREATARHAAEIERDAARKAMADWTAGGPLARALRALIYRR